MLIITCILPLLLCPVIASASIKEHQSHTGLILNSSRYHRLLVFLEEPRVGQPIGDVAALIEQIKLTSQELSSQFKQRIFYVDDSVRRDLVFRVSSLTDRGSLTWLRVSVRSPSGVVFGYWNSSDFYEADTAMGTVVIRIPDAHIQVGNWTMSSDGFASDTQPDGRHSGIIMVTGRPIENATEAPVVLTAEVSPSIVDLIIENTRISVYARLLRGHAPVTNGRLTANVRSNAGFVAALNLTDSGTGADLKANDGIYSGHLPISKLNQAREFSVSVTALWPVNRVASAGKLTVRNSNSRFNPQLLTPGKVSDLRVVVNATAKLVVLEWTSIRDPVMSDQSASYDIRFSNSQENLLQNFSNCERLLLPELASATTGVAIKVNVFHEFSNKGFVVLALKALSSQNVSGQTSNLIGFDLTPPSTLDRKRFGLLPNEVNQSRSNLDYLKPVLLAAFVALVAACCCQCCAGFVQAQRSISGSPPGGRSRRLFHSPHAWREATPLEP